MKNKQLVWVSGAVVALLIVGSGVWLWHAHQAGGEVASDLYGAATNVSQYQAGASAGTSDTLQQTAQTQQTTGPNASARGSSLSSSTQTTQQISGNTNSAGSDASKLLDPTSFAQYDKYKSGTSTQYIDLQPGTGATLANGQKAAVYYRGWLTNGTLFDQSRAGSDGNLEPFNFVLGAHQVISGWEQGLAGMKAGGVRLLIVPPAVGYGASGQATIPGNAVLVFQVQLIAVQ